MVLKYLLLRHKLVILRRRLDYSVIEQNAVRAADKDAAKDMIALIQSCMKKVILLVVLLSVMLKVLLLG